MDSILLWGHTTYLVTGLEALSLNTSVSIGLNTDTSGVHGSENIVDLTNELLVGSVDLTSQKGNFVSIDHSDEITLNSVLESSNFNNLGRGSLLESTSEAASATTEATASSSVSTAETTSVSATESTASTSLFKAHF
jgi:hypothetical protein